MFLSTPNTHHSTPTFSCNVLWYLYAGGLLWVRNSAQMGSVKSVSSVREKPPQRFSKMFYFSQKNTEEQNTQSFTETLSQPISQSVTANVSWKASVNSVCRRPSVCSKRAQKGSVNSVRSVREKTHQRERKTSSMTFKCPFSHWGCILLLTDLHRWTEHIKAHRDIKSTDFTEPYSHLWQ